MKTATKLYDSDGVELYAHSMDWLNEYQVAKLQPTGDKPRKAGRLCYVTDDKRVIFAAAHVIGDNSRWRWVYREVDYALTPSLHRCDWRCQRAEKRVCQCSCRGQNHGAGTDLTRFAAKAGTA